MATVTARLAEQGTLIMTLLSTTFWQA